MDKTDDENGILKDEGKVLSVDGDADGNPEIIAMDGNQDGKSEIVVVDVDSDGSADGVFIDLTGDGVPDISIVDADSAEGPEGYTEEDSDAGEVDTVTADSGEEGAETPLMTVQTVTPAGEEVEHYPESIPAIGAVYTPAVSPLEETEEADNEEEEEQDESGDDSGESDDESEEAEIVTDEEEAAQQADAGEEDTTQAEAPEQTASPEEQAQDLEAQGAASADTGEAESAESPGAAPVETPETAEPTPQEEGKVADVRYEAVWEDHIDTARIDRDGDGWFEETANVESRDVDGDGARDTAFADLNGDGNTEIVGEDSDKDGVMNRMADGDGHLEEGSVIHSAETRTIDENLKEVSGENDADTHSGWNAREETIDSSTSMKYDSDGNVSVLRDGEEAQVANIDDVTHRVGTEGEAAIVDVGLDGDDRVANVFVDTEADDEAGAITTEPDIDSSSDYTADDSGGYDSGGYAADTSGGYDSGDYDSGGYAADTSASYDAGSTDTSSYDSGE